MFEKKIRINTTAIKEKDLLLSFEIHILEISNADKNIIIFKNSLITTSFEYKTIYKIIGYIIPAVIILLYRLFNIKIFQIFY